MNTERSRVIIADLPISERPRERMARHGADALSDSELIAILIEPGRRGKSSIDLARELVADGLPALARREWIPGKRAGSLGASRVARIGAAIELGRRIASSSRDGEPVLDSTSLGKSLVARYSHDVQERLGAVYLDSRKRIIREREIYIGTLSTATVSTRDVFRIALEEGAAAVVVFHNHPSGDPMPSAEDVRFTRALVTAGSLMEIEVVDHLIIGSSRFVSLRERQLL
jgi:DNA repair protein RadC